MEYLCPSLSIIRTPKACGYWQIFHRLLTNVIRNAPSGFGYATHNSSKRVGIGSE